jgi:hypothetical protein
MTTTYKQQMQAIKLAMKQRVNRVADIYFEHHQEKISFNTITKKDKQWKALNDAYSTLAAIALMDYGKQVHDNKNMFADVVQYLGPRFTKDDLY